MKGTQHPLWIDSDNALGSPFGDIDDAFGLAAILCSQTPVATISCVYGNTFEPWVFRNVKTLSKICGYKGRILRGANVHWAKASIASQELAKCSQPIRLLALGPMTNVALAIQQNATLMAQSVQELIFPGSNLKITLPAFRFIDFNHWKDPKAAKAVFSSNISLTCVPSDLARTVRITENEMEEISGPLGEYMRENARRWFLQAKYLKRSLTVPLWDLAPSMYALKPDLFQVRETNAVLEPHGGMTFGVRKGRPIRVITDIDAKGVLDRFFDIVKITQEVKLKDGK